ncbi:hypothetical protein RhiJN_12238 [Ceratobasidium sp. AG-Ba]|nr:hypothetical protein RhiJN_12238 [Ceratobasidium sp. AG-Ba]
MENAVEFNAENDYEITKLPLAALDHPADQYPEFVSTGVLLARRFADSDLSSQVKPEEIFIEEEFHYRVYFPSCAAM